MATLTLEDIVTKTSDLPTIPAAALAVMKEAESSLATASTVARHLSQDQSLTMRVLRLSNSAYYGLSRQVLEIQDAVVVLGMRSVRNLALVAATYPWLIKPLQGYDLGPKAMWTHAFSVAVGAQLVAQRAGLRESDNAFTAGLLHNIGKVVLSIWLENKLKAMQLLAVRDNQTFDEIERRVLGYDHAEVGAYLADNWNLPKALVAAIRYHHDPNSLDPSNPIVDCVHIGDYLTMSMGFGLGGDGLRYDFQPETLKRLGLEPADIDQLTADFVDACQKYERIFEEIQPAA